MVFPLFFLCILTIVSCRCSLFSKNCDTWNYRKEEYYVTDENGQPKKITSYKTIYNSSCKKEIYKTYSEFSVSRCVSSNNGFYDCDVQRTKSQMAITSYFNDATGYKCNPIHNNQWKSIKDLDCFNTTDSFFNGYFNIQKEHVFVNDAFFVLGGRKFDRSGTCPVDWLFIFQIFLFIVILMFAVVICGICIYYQRRVLHSRLVNEQNKSAESGMVKRKRKHRKYL